MGFEARWTSGGWQVIEVPTLDDAAQTPPSTRPGGPAAAAPQAAAALPPPGSGPLDGLAPYRPQTTCSPAAKPGVTGFRNLVLAAYPATAGWASPGTARSAAPASTRRAGSGTGVWR